MTTEDDDDSFSVDSWTDELEVLMQKWKHGAQRYALFHREAGKKIESKHNIFGLPPILIPLAMTFITTTLPEGPPATYANGSMFLLSGISASLYKWLNLGQTYGRHYAHSSRWHDLAMKIDMELTLPRTKRHPVINCITDFRATIKELISNQPKVPDFRCLCVTHVEDPGMLV